MGSCVQMCGQVGMSCCGGGGGGCRCSPATACPQCQLHPDANAYTECDGSSSSCPFCLNGWRFCSPTCSSPGSKAAGCPKPSPALGQTTASPYCEFSNNGAAVADN